MKTRYRLLFVLSLFSVSCSKEDDETRSNVPSIEAVSVSPLQLQEFSGPLTFTIRYADGDGDLGENNADVKNLFIRDERIGIVYAYRIPQLAPSGSSVPIQGELQIELTTVVRTDSVAQQQAVFSAYVDDRAGNRSNTVSFQPVTITQN